MNRSYASPATSKLTRRRYAARGPVSSLGSVPRLLIVHHSPTPSVAALTEAVVAGASDDAVTGVDVVVRAALEADAGDVRSVQSIVGALGWRQSAPVLEVLGDVGESQRESAYDLGGTLAALVMG